MTELPQYLQDYSTKDKYPHGYPFSEKLALNIYDLIDRVKQNKASLIVVDGGVGEGKTTLAVHIADLITQRPIVLEEQLAMGGEELVRKLKLCYHKKLPVLIYDEAGDFNKRGSLSRFNQTLNRIFETFRGFKIIIIACLPNFNVLDNQLFDNKIPRLLLHLRGRTQRHGNFHGYSFTQMQWLRYHMQRNKFIKEMSFKKVRPNFMGHFLDLPAARSKELDAFSTKGKLGFLAENSKKMEGLLTYQDLEKKTGRSIPWLRKTVGKLRIRPAKVEKKTRYFNDAILSQIMEQAKYKKGE
jgi:hypothetical protein